MALTPSQGQAAADSAWNAEALRSLMEERGITVTQLAATVGTTESTVRAWLRGTGPRFVTVARLMGVFSVPMETFILRPKSKARAR